MSEPKTGPELALLRVKRKQRKMRRDIDKMNKQAQVEEENRIEASLIGELKAAQSNNRNAKMKDTVSVTLFIYFIFFEGKKIL